MANELFTAQCIWRGPYDNEEVIYNSKKTFF